jgi:predicted transcriptional regulator
MEKSASSNKERIIQFIKNNPNATYKNIRKNTKLHPERLFKEGMAEIYREAGIKAPRNFNFKDIKKRRELIVDFIKDNTSASTNEISKKLKINVSSAFKDIKEAYKLAGVEYPRYNSYKKSPNEKRNEIISLIKENPYLTLTELINKTNIKNLYRLFKNYNEAYQKAGILIKKPGEKIRNRKYKKVVEYIKNNPLATQREINKHCKTHVQEIFKRGILEAYEKSGVEYPFERRKVHGTALKTIKERAKNFEEEIAIKLSGFGTVNRLVKIKRGIADIILERKNKKIVIEIKDYQLKEISISQVKQLNNYMEDINSNIGILICHKKPKRDRFLIGKNQIFVLEDQELNKILEIV